MLQPRRVVDDVISRAFARGILVSCRPPSAARHLGLSYQGFSLSAAAVRCVFMKKNAPPEFLNEYYARRRYLDQALEELTRLLTQRLAQLSARTGTRARLVDYRVKRPGKVWKNGLSAGLSVRDVCKGRRLDRSEDRLQ
jgi:hypothetical protein